MKRTKNNPRAGAKIAADVREIYAELTQRKIERNCTRLTECCQFKITGRTPFLTKGEAVTAAMALRATGRKSLTRPADGACPVFDAARGGCLIYEARPFGCRTHFCAAAGGPCARREVADLIHRLESIDSELGGCGAENITTAMSKALTGLS